MLNKGRIFTVMKKIFKPIIAAILTATLFASAVPATTISAAAASTSSSETSEKTITLYVTRNCYSYKTADSNSAKVKKYRKGAAVKVTGTSSNYYRLADGSFIEQSNLNKKRINWTETKYKSPLIRYAVKNNVKVRSGALGTSDVIDTLEMGTMLEISARTNSGYYKLKDGGYILKSSVTKKAVKYVCDPSDHDFYEATCTRPATCMACGITKGTVIDHSNYMDSVYAKGDDVYIEWACVYCDYSYVEVYEGVLDAEKIRNSIMAFQETYPEGTPFTNDNYYGWNGGIYSGGYGCAGFSFMLSDAAFGEIPARYIYDIDELRVGDIVRINNDTHSVIVTDISGDTITVAEGNYNRSVHWGRTFDKSTLKFTYIITRYPENYKN